MSKNKRGHYNEILSVGAKITGFLPKSFIKIIYHFFKNTDGWIGLGMRYICMKHLLKECGENVAIFPYTIIKHPENLIIGKNVSIHPFCYLDAVGGIQIKDNVSIANHTSLISFGHTWVNSEEPIKYNPLVMTPISINDDVWIGCGVRIIGPCEIGSRVIVAAGAVARGNLQEKAIYGGVPAKILKYI